MNKQQVLARIQALQKEGLSYQAITDRLIAENIPTLSGRGTWSKATVYNLLKKHTESLKKGKKKTARNVSPVPVQLELTGPAPARPEEPSEEWKQKYERIRNAYNTALKEVDRLTREVSEARTEASRAREQEQAGIEQTIQDAVEPLVEKIERLETMLTGTSLGRTRKPVRRGLKVLDWNIVRNGSYWRAFGRVGGRQVGVFLGKTFDVEKAKAKINAKLEELKENNKQNKPDKDNEKTGLAKEPDAESAPGQRNMVLEIIRKRGGRSRTAAIWRCVKDAEQAGISRDIFRQIVDGLVAEMAVQLVQGDPNQTPETEQDKLLWMDETIKAPYCSIILIT